ncbi:TAP-like protein-domain-containing protein [Fomes fomentarius]|nr:TAP-like protein-domain-containing protein [Fomes fomentarius]
MKLWHIICTISPSLCTHSSTIALGHTQSSSIHWGPCDSSLDSSLSCAFFDIPLDYHNRSAGLGRLALIKANATHERRGTVFMKPGGPGVSGSEALNATGPLLLDQTGGFYDVVSWDPRGVGALTTPGDITCFDSVEEQQAFFAGTVERSGIEELGHFTDKADIQGLLAQASTMQQKYEDLGKRCLQHPNGKYLQYVGTAATVRDIAALADALDGPGSAINYIGLSYGTVIGSWLVNMFPERVGHVVIDGVVDPVRFSKEDTSLGWSQNLVDADQTYNAFVTGCTLAGPDVCPLASTGHSPLDVHESIQALFKTAHDAFRMDPSVPVTSGQLRSVFRTAMYLPGGWQSLVNDTLPAIIEQIRGEAYRDARYISCCVGSCGLPRMMTIRRSASAKRQQESVPQSPYSPAAIMCSDNRESSANMTVVFQGIISTSQNISHMLGAAWPLAPYYCPFWPASAVERCEGPFNKSLANPILVIGNTYDPATPCADAKAAAQELGDRATLVRLNAFGHTSQAGPSVCMSDIIRAYMVNGTLPEGNDTVCEVDPDFEIFVGVNTSAIFTSMLAEDHI